MAKRARPLVLPVEKMRELLGESASTLDERELEGLREQMYRLAEHIVSAARAGGARQWSMRAGARNPISPDALADLNERAAIMEFDGGLCRDDAERRALEIVVGHASEDTR